MNPSLGIIGLGRIGMAAAEVFIKNGHTVHGYARREAVRAAFAALGGVNEDSPAAVAATCDTVIIVVLNDAQVLDVALSEQGLLSTMRPGGLIIGMSTIEQAHQEQVAAACAARGIDFVDSPLTGGPARARRGSLALFVAAPTAMVDRARPYLEQLGHIHQVGERPGMAQSAKHCNQLLVSSVHAVTCEIIHLTRKLGLDPVQVCDIIGNGIAGNDYFRLLVKSVLEDATPPGSLGQLAKDSNILCATARSLHMPLLVGTAANQYFQAALAQGLENEESSELIRIIERLTP